MWVAAPRSFLCRCSVQAQRGTWMSSQRPVTRIKRCTCAAYRLSYPWTCGGKSGELLLQVCSWYHCPRTLECYPPPRRITWQIFLLALSPLPPYSNLVRQLQQHPQHFDHQHFHRWAKVFTFRQPRLSFVARISCLHSQARGSGLTQGSYQLSWPWYRRSKSA